MKVRFVFVFLLTLILWALVYSFFLNTDPAKASATCVETKTFSLDKHEDHFLAVNYALHNRFPVIGFLSPEADYKICNIQHMEIYFNMMRQNGPVVFLSRPPLYPLVIGSIYKFTGVRPGLEYRFTLLLAALMVVLMPFAGYKLFKMPGVVLGLLSMLLCLNYYIPSYYTPALNFSAFLVFILFLTSLFLSPKRPVLYFVFGALCVLSILTKGIFIFVPFLFLFSLLYKTIKFKSADYLLNGAAMFIGVLMFLMPWAIFINAQKNASVAQRAAWHAKTIANMPAYTVRSSADLNINSDLPPVALDFLIRQIYLTYMIADSYITITNQLHGEGLLIGNNEFCTDGDWHMEWKMLPTSYHNTHHQNQPVALRAILFYAENPVLFCKIMMGKINNTGKDKPEIVWFTASLWGLFMLQLSSKNKFWQALIVGAMALSVYFVLSHAVNITLWFYIPLFLLGLLFYRIKNEPEFPLIFPMLVLNLLIINLMFLGSSRFFVVANPVALICSLYFMYKITDRFFRQVLLR